MNQKWYKNLMVKLNTCTILINLTNYIQNIQHWIIVLKIFRLYTYKQTLTWKNTKFYLHSFNHFQFLRAIFDQWWQPKSSNWRNVNIISPSSGLKGLCNVQQYALVCGACSAAQISAVQWNVGKCTAVNCNTMGTVQNESKYNM